MKCIHVTALETEGFTWSVEGVAPDGLVAPLLARHDGKVVCLTGHGWRNVPLSLDGIDIVVGGRRIPASATWREVAGLVEAMTAGDVEPETHLACSAMDAAVTPRPGALDERVELAAARLFEDWCGSQKSQLCETSWARINEARRASWRRRAALFLHLLDGGDLPEAAASSKAEDRAAAALAFAWMTDIESRIAPDWLRRGGWASEGEADRRPVWRLRALRVADAVRALESAAAPAP